MLVGENASGGTPKQKDQEAWVQKYGLTYPVVSDGGWKVSNNIEADGYIPSMTVLGPGLEVIAVDKSNWEKTVKDLLNQ